MPHESDRELVERFVAGDTRAFDVIHNRYFGLVYRLAYMHTGNRDDAEDVASDTFYRALVHIRQYRFQSSDSLYAWLYRICVNLCIDLCREQSARRTYSLNAEAVAGIHTFLERIEDTKPSPLDIVQQQEVQELVRSAIAALSDSQREAVLHRFLGEMSIKEIAEAMQRSVGSTKSLLYRAFQSLRKEILERVSEAERLWLLGQREESTDARRDSSRVYRRIDDQN